jgi:hypothetical protein
VIISAREQEFDSFVPPPGYAEPETAVEKRTKALKKDQQP